MPRPSPYRLSDEQLSAIAATDWARLAAFIDGEGHIRIVRYKAWSRSFARNLTISNTDVRLILWLKSTFGGWAYTWPSRKLTYKPLSEWTAPAGLSEQLLERCLSYLIIKREQAEIFLAFAKLVNSGGGRLKVAAIDQREELVRRFHEQKVGQSGHSQAAHANRIH